MSNNLLATIDMGSNSFRLLVAKITPDGILQPIDQIKDTVRLAAGLDKNNNLTPQSQQDALAVLLRFGERLAGFDANSVRVVATSTLRVAKNAKDFIKEARKVLGFEIEVISGNEEARLIYIGAMHSLAYSKDKRLVIDIGGGSTEFIIGRGYDPQIMESVTMGCVSFSNRYFTEGNLTETNFDNAIFNARSKIQAMEHLFANHDWVLAIGTSGTAHALYDLCVSYGFSNQISLESLYKIKRMLVKAKNIDSINLTRLKDDRKAVMPGGISIMIAIMQELNIEEMTIADGALREGVMYDMLGRSSDEDLRQTTVASLKKRYEIDLVQSKHVFDIAHLIYTSLQKKIDPNTLKLFDWACQLYEIGLSISHNDYHKHGAYILANADLAGFSKPEQTIIADLVRTHRGGLVKAMNSLVDSRKVIKLMILAFRFSVIFNRKRQSLPENTILKVDNLDKNHISFTLNKKWVNQNPLTLYSLNEEIEAWKKLDYDIDLVLA